MFMVSAVIMAGAFKLNELYPLSSVQDEILQIFRSVILLGCVYHLHPLSRNKGVGAGPWNQR